MTATVTPHGRVTPARTGERISARKHFQPLADRVNEALDTLRAPQQVGKPEQAAPTINETNVTQVITSPDGLVLIATGATIDAITVTNEDETAEVDVDRFAVVRGVATDGRPFLIDLRRIL